MFVEQMPKELLDRMEKVSPGFTKRRAREELLERIAADDRRDLENLQNKCRALTITDLEKVKNGPWAPSFLKTSNIDLEEFRKVSVWFITLWFKTICGDYPWDGKHAWVKYTTIQRLAEEEIGPVSLGAVVATLLKYPTPHSEETCRVPRAMFASRNQDITIDCE